MRKTTIFFAFLLLLSCSKQPRHHIDEYNNIHITFVGDSITYGVHTKKRYVDFLKEKISFKQVSVSATAGSCVSKHSDYGMKYNPLTTRLDDIPSSSDLIVFFMGTNDYKHDTPMGMSDDKEDVSFLGALNYTFNTIRNNIPNAKIMYITPLQRTDFVIANSFGLYLLDYVNAIIELCSKYKIVALDAFSNIDINEYLVDGIHPDKDGHEIIADAIYKSFDSTAF